MNDKKELDTYKSINDILADQSRALISNTQNNINQDKSVTNSHSSSHTDQSVRNIKKTKNIDHSQHYTEQNLQVNDNRTSSYNHQHRSYHNHQDSSVRIDKSTKSVHIGNKVRSTTVVKNYYLNITNEGDGSTQTVAIGAGAFNALSAQQKDSTPKTLGNSERFLRNKRREKEGLLLFIYAGIVFILVALAFRAGLIKNSREKNIENLEQRMRQPQGLLDPAENKNSVRLDLVKSLPFNASANQFITQTKPGTKLNTPRQTLTL